MQLILSIDSDQRQVEQLAALVRGRLAVELVQTTSAGEGLQALGDRVPDLIMTSPLLSPFDDGVLAEYLRELGPAGAHVQTLRIPVISAPKPTGRGLFSLRRKKPEAAPDGCDPKVLADEIAVYLARAADERAAALSETISRSPAATDHDLPSAYGEGTPAPYTPAYESPAYEAFADPTPIYQAPDDAGVDQAPIYQVPPYETPIYQADAGGMAVTETPVYEAPAHETGVHEEPADETPLYEPPVRESLRPITSLDSLTLADLQPQPRSKTAMPVQDSIVHAVEPTAPTQSERPAEATAHTAIVPEPPQAPAPERTASFESALAAIRNSWGKRQQPEQTSVPVEALPTSVAEVDLGPAVEAMQVSGATDQDVYELSASPALHDLDSDLAAAAPPRVVPAVLPEPEPERPATVETLPAKAATADEKPKKRSEKRKGKPRKTAPKLVQDEWGLFDPSQCGFAAVVDKLNQVTDEDEGPPKTTTVRVISYR